MVSVIIPTTKGGIVYLTKLIPILSQEEVEIIIINNNSKDGTMNYLTNWNVKVINNQTPMNFSQSNNEGVTIAKHENILFLNNDTIPQPGFTKVMAERLGEYDIIGTLIYTMTNPKKVQHIGVCFNQDYVPYELGLPVPELSPGIPPGDHRVRQEREVPSVTACCMMTTKTFFNKVGGFDEEYQNGWEDTDFVLRAREKGGKVWYTGKTWIFHKGSGSANVGRFLKEKENRDRYDRIWVHTGRAKTVLDGFREA